MEDYRKRKKQYTVQARRKDSKAKWTEWAVVDGYETAEKHVRRAEELGYQARIVERGEDQDE